MPVILKTLVNFNYSNGAYPLLSNLLLDANGNLFGTTYEGGPDSLGTVFEIAKTASGYASSPTTLFNTYTPAGNYGAYPLGGLVADANGNLFGTTVEGGYDYGTLFEIPKTATGYGAGFALTSFNYSNGYEPLGNLTIDAKGDLFGTTAYGGNGYGNVFELVNNGTVANPSYASNPTDLGNFNYSNGYYPTGGLITDAHGDLLGTAYEGGTNSYGAVFELVKDASSPTGFDTPIALVNFNYSNGAYPYGSLTTDTHGNLFGTTYDGGTSGYGTVFEVMKTATGYANTPTVLANFNYSNGDHPYGNLVADSHGDLFGVTYEGGANGYGTVFEIPKTASGYGSLVTVFSFNGSNGANPASGLTIDSHGNLFGTTYEGGTNGVGTAFEIPFVPLSITGSGSEYVKGPTNPLSNVVIDDWIAQNETVTVSSSSSFVKLVDPHAATDGGHSSGNTFTFTGTAAQVTADVQGLQLVAGIGNTNITVNATNSWGAHDSESTTVHIMGIILSHA